MKNKSGFFLPVCYLLSFFFYFYNFPTLDRLKITDYQTTSNLPLYLFNLHALLFTNYEVCASTRRGLRVCAAVTEDRTSVLIGHRKHYVVKSFCQQLCGWKKCSTENVVRIDSKSAAQSDSKPLLLWQVERQMLFYASNL